METQPEPNMMMCSSCINDNKIADAHRAFLLDVMQKADRYAQHMEAPTIEGFSHFLAAVEIVHELESHE